MNTIVAVVAAAAVFPTLASAQTGTACTNVNNDKLTGQCQGSDGTTINFDLSCLQPPKAKGSLPYFSQELDDSGDSSDYFYYLSLFGLPDKAFGKCNLPADQAAGNTATQAAKDGTACYALGTKTSGSWTYNDATLGAASISIQYSTDTRSVQVDIICDESAATPVYSATGEDPQQPGNYNLQLTSMYACKDKAGTKTCEAPSAGKSAGGKGGTVFVGLFFGLSAGYWGIGFIYLAFVKKAEGNDRILNYTFLSTVPGLVKDGIRFVTSCGKASGGTYESV